MIPIKLNELKVGMDIIAEIGQGGYKKAKVKSIYNNGHKAIINIPNFASTWYITFNTINNCWGGNGDSYKSYIDKINWKERLSKC